MNLNLIRFILKAFYGSLSIGGAVTRSGFSGAFFVSFKERYKLISFCLHF